MVFPCSGLGQFMFDFLEPLLLSIQVKDAPIGRKNAPVPDLTGLLNLRVES